MIYGNYTSETSSLQVGSVSPQKFVAKEEIKNEVATQRNIDKALSEMSSLYTQDSAVQKRVTENVNSFFDYIASNSDALKNDYQNSSNELSSKIYLSSNQIYTLVNMEKDDFYKFKNDLIKIINSALEQGIREDNEDKILIYVKSELSDLNLTSRLYDIGYTIISSVLEPNLIIDVDATEKAKNEKLATIEPVMVLKNQKIVDAGEIINEEIYSILYTGGYIQKNTLIENIIPLTGIALIILFIYMLTVYYLYKFHLKLYTGKNETLLLFSLYIILTVSVKLLSNVSVPYMFMPILTFTMLAAMLLNYRLAIILNFSVCIIYYIAFNFSTAFLIYFTITGMFAAFMANLLKKYNHIFKISLISCIVATLVMFAVTLYTSKSFDFESVRNLFYAFFNGIITIIICTGSMPIWEFAFGVITQYKLLELINPDNALLRKLMLECPGTYNHSIIVANLAEAAAFEIGADSALAKVGSYYHDIGKLKYSQYFSENIRGKNPHDSMNPYKSAKIISNHVADGIEYAKKYKLPAPVKDIIAQHHGNTVMNFFYYKAKQMSENGQVNESDFRYKQEKPKSKEAAIVMLADTVEAAVRSKNITNLKEIEKFVHELIKGKLIDEQFSSCSLKTNELDKIEFAFMKVLSGMYHERVAYPTEKNKTETSEKVADKTHREERSPKNSEKNNEEDKK